MPYAELLEFNQPSPIRKEGFTKIRDQYELAKPVSEQTPVTFNPDTGEITGWCDHVSHYDPERIVEFAGRADYGPKNTAKLGKDDTIIPRWIDAGHHSMLEFASATFYIECSRVVSHELVRHRLANFQQESQRYVKYEDVDAEELFVTPDFNGDDTGLSAAVRKEYEEALSAYRILRSAGVKAQLARYVLPNGTMTRLVMKANLREWRHIVNLRTAKAAQPEMRELALQIQEQLEDVFPRIMYKATDSDQIR